MKENKQYYVDAYKVLKTTYDNTVESCNSGAITKKDAYETYTLVFLEARRTRTQCGILVLKTKIRLLISLKSL